MSSLFFAAIQYTTTPAPLVQDSTTDLVRKYESRARSTNLNIQKHKAKIVNIKTTREKNTGCLDYNIKETLNIRVFRSYCAQYSNTLNADGTIVINTNVLTNTRRKRLSKNTERTIKSFLKRTRKPRVYKIIPKTKHKSHNRPINSSSIVAKSHISETTKTTMVLSPDQFIFKPPIAINETNYPLENSDKVELLADDTNVDKVLSYGFTDPSIKNYMKFPSVSKIIEETISEKTKQVLANWRQKMIEDLGEDGFFNHSEGLKVRGQEFHQAVRNAVLGQKNENSTEVTENSLKSLSWLLEHISNPMAVESTIAHPKLGYRGVADCIAMFRNIPVIIDWKLSDKPKRDLKDTYDAPVQITAYIGALNHDPNYKWGVNHGLVAVAYSNGDPCDVFLLAPKHCSIYWRHWLMRFDKFKARSHLHLDHNIDEKSLEMI